MKCEACERDDHDNYGMQMWCDCDCEGYDPYGIPDGYAFRDDLDGGRMFKKDHNQEITMKEEYDPMADLINANRDEILRKHQEAIRLIRAAMEPIATTGGAADQRLVFNRANYVLAVLDALNTFYPMHGESWRGWPSDALTEPRT